VILSKLKRIIVLFICLLETGRVFAQTPSTADETLSGTPISTLAIDPQDSRIVYAGSSKGIFKSTDGGSSWVLLGDASPTGTTALVIDPQNSDTILAVTYNDYDDGVFKTLDGGITWTKLLKLVGAWTIAVDPHHTDSVLVGAGYGDIGSTPAIVKSVDGGASWRYTSNFTIYALAIDPQNSGIVYAGGNGAFLKSTDGGQNWDAPIPFWPFGYITSLAVDSKNPGTIYAGTYRTGVLKSTDAGSNWTSVTADLGEISARYVVADPNEANVLYASFSLGNGSSADWGGLLKTTDGGSTWRRVSKLNSVLIRSLAVDPKTAGTIYVGTESGVWKTPDGGSTWSANSGFPILYLGVNPCISGVWYLRVSNAPANSPIQLLGTSDGQSWQIPNWRNTNSNGAFAESGIFAPGTEGSYSLHVDVGGVNSNSVSFVVSSCKR
jgi:photosystem II stability/assembly factor-like uncharacterized protein